MFTDDAYIDYSSAGVIAGSRDEVAEFLSQGFAAIPMSMHYITNIEVLDIDVDTARVRAMFYNPMQLPGMIDLSYCGGYYYRGLVRTPDGWKSRKLTEDNVYQPTLEFPRHAVTNWPWLRSKHHGGVLRTTAEVDQKHPVVRSMSDYRRVSRWARGATGQPA